MATWLEDTIKALENIGGVAHYQQIYDEVSSIRKQPLPTSWKAIIRRTIETYSSDSEAYNGEKDLFYSVEGIGSGVWGLRGGEEKTTTASDIKEPQPALRSQIEVYRILRDTTLTKRLKKLHKNKCQICGETLKLKSGENYSEAHHIKPLGRPHNGPDVAENIIVLCPNHHVLADYGSIKLDLAAIRILKGHSISTEYINYHNNKIAK